MSRIMLAIKTTLAETDAIKSLIFDEIDSGIGGEVAIAVGRHLRDLAKEKQILCVTHLATIAVHADSHIKVEKTIDENRTISYRISQPLRQFRIVDLQHAANKRNDQQYPKNRNPCGPIQPHNAFTIPVSDSCVSARSSDCRPGVNRV